MDPDTPLTLGAALVLGLGGSLHCFAMCGPLACAAQGGRAQGRLTRAFLYQGARILAYATVGAILGAASGGAARALSLPVGRALPWVMAAALLLSVAPPIRALARVRPPRVVSAILARAAQLRAYLSPNAEAALLGALTPLLPCGLLYGIAAGALASGGPVRGALLMSSFALAALPALVAAQWGAARVGRALSVRVWGRALPLVAAGALILRATQIAAHHACH